MVLKSGVLAAFFSQFFPFITSDGRLLRQLAVCYMTLARSVNVLYVYNSNLFYYIFLKVKLVNLKRQPLWVLFFISILLKKIHYIWGFKITSL